MLLTTAKTFLYSERLNRKKPFLGWLPPVFYGTREAE